MHLIDYVRQVLYELGIGRGGDIVRRRRALDGEAFAARDDDFTDRVGFRLFECRTLGGTARSNIGGAQFSPGRTFDRAEQDGQNRGDLLRKGLAAPPKADGVVPGDDIGGSQCGNGGGERGVLPITLDHMPIQQGSKSGQMRLRRSRIAGHCGGVRPGAMRLRQEWRDWGAGSTTKGSGDDQSLDCSAHCFGFG